MQKDHHALDIWMTLGNNENNTYNLIHHILNLDFVKLKHLYIKIISYITY